MHCSFKSSFFRLLVVCLLFLAQPSANARVYNHYDFSVPVYVISDRTVRNSVTRELSEKPLSLDPNIIVGVVHVPVKMKTVCSVDASKLETWGCSTLEKSDQTKMSRKEIMSQLLSPPGTPIPLDVRTQKSLDNMDGFIASLNNEIAKSGTHELLIFVHGCCEAQQQSLSEAAKLSIYCGCPVLLFDWASPSVLQAGLWTYMQSDRALEFTEIYFGKLMEHIRANCPGTKITLVAHSMGSRLARNYLRQFPKALIDQIYLVRPDISLPVFLIEQDKFEKQFRQMYIFVSKSDLLLRCSELLMSSHIERLGRQHKPSRWFENPVKNTPDNITIIDTSSMFGNGFTGHKIPYEAIGDIHNLKAQTNSAGFKIEKPFSSNPQFWKLKFSP